MSEAALRELIDRGDVEGLRQALRSNPALANQAIRWHLNQDNESDPLHYVCDAVSQGWLTNGREGEIASLLIEYGAAIDGNAGRESPLIAAASLNAGRVARVLVEAGANLEAIALFGARAIHWAAWTGDAATVDLLIRAGARIDERCSEFGATPLFWAAHGYGPQGDRVKRNQVEAARLLIAAGADIRTANKSNESLLTMARQGANSDLYDLLLAHGAREA